MALDPLTREGLLAGRMLDSLRRRAEQGMEERLRKLVRADQLIQELRQNLMRQLEARSTIGRVPDVVQVISAYRAWRAVSVKGQVRLLALGMEVVWAPRQKAEAECIPLPSLAKLGLASTEAGRCQHDAPNFDCRCGIWGFKSFENLLLALGRGYRPSVMGKVSLWGRVIETENGYRAQYAYPEELWAGDASSAEELRLTYGVPVMT